MHAKCEFLIFKFSKVMQQHTEGVMGNLILVLLEIYSSASLRQWTDFANRSRIDKVIAMIRVAPFFDSRCSSHFDQISVKKISFGGPIPLSLNQWGEIWHGGEDRAKFHPYRCNLSPLQLQGEKPQNRPLSNLNNRRFALRAMLPVNYPGETTNGYSHFDKHYNNVTWAV